MHKLSLCILLCCFVHFCLGQQKIAHVDVDALFSSLDAYKEIQQDLEIYQKQLVKQLDKDKKAIAVFYKETMQAIKAGSLTPKQQQAAESELQKKQEAVTRQSNEIDRKLLDRQQSLTKPLYETFETALKKEAQKRNLAYILDAKTLMNNFQGVDLTASIQKYFK